MTARETKQRLARQLKRIVREAEELLQVVRDDSSEQSSGVNNRLAMALIDSAKAAYEYLQEDELIQMNNGLEARRPWATGQRGNLAEPHSQSELKRFRARRSRPASVSREGRRAEREGFRDRFV